MTVIGQVFIGVGAVLWLTAVIVVARDQRSSLRRRLTTIGILVVTVPIAVLYWLRSR